MPLTPPTLVAPTAVGRLLELGQFVVTAQLNQPQNPNSAAVITDLNLDHDTKTGSFVVNFTFTNSTSPTTGALVSTADDPFND